MANAQVLSRLTADIDSLHERCNTLRRSLGHVAPLESEVNAVKKHHSRPEAALLSLRDAKASELQLLSSEDLVRVLPDGQELCGPLGPVRVLGRGPLPGPFVLLLVGSSVRLVRSRGVSGTF